MSRTLGPLKTTFTTSRSIASERNAVLISLAQAKFEVRADTPWLRLRLTQRKRCWWLRLTLVRRGTSIWFAYRGSMKLIGSTIVVLNSMVHFRSEVGTVSFTSGRNWSSGSKLCEASFNFRVASQFSSLSRQNVRAFRTISSGRESSPSSSSRVSSRSICA